MGLFGWSLPPGCGRLSGEEDCPCAVCGLMDDCICPECPECGQQGDTACYEPAPKGHGLVRTDAQNASLAAQEARWREDAAAEAAADDAWARDMRKAQEDF